jgi:hypothetical protein
LRRSAAEFAAAITGGQQAKKLLAKAANCESAMIPDEVRIGTFERWDNLAHLRLVRAIEQQIGR